MAQDFNRRREGKEGTCPSTAADHNHRVRPDLSNLFFPPYADRSGTPTSVSVDDHPSRTCVVIVFSKPGYAGCGG